MKAGAPKGTPAFFINNRSQQKHDIQALHSLSRNLDWDNSYSNVHKDCSVYASSGDVCAYDAGYMPDDHSTWQADHAHGDRSCTDAGWYNDHHAGHCVDRGYPPIELLVTCKLPSIIAAADKYAVFFAVCVM